MKHTKGPWKMYPNPMRDDGWFVKGANGEMGLTCTQTSEADARLIAAAPELLCVLKYLINSCETDCKIDTECRAIIKDAKSVIAKAEGD